jgi:hypothetical protein
MTNAPEIFDIVGYLRPQGFRVEARLADGAWWVMPYLFEDDDQRAAFLETLRAKNPGRQFRPA